MTELAFQICLSCFAAAQQQPYACDGKQIRQQRYDGKKTPAAAKQPPARAAPGTTLLISLRVREARPRRKNPYRSSASML
jgi:hypothetical protein